MKIGILKNIELSIVNDYSICHGQSSGYDRLMVCLAFHVWGILCLYTGYKKNVAMLSWRYIDVKIFAQLRCIRSSFLLIMCRLFCGQ